MDPIEAAILAAPLDTSPVSDAERAAIAEETPDEWVSHEELVQALSARAPAAE